MAQTSYAWIRVGTGNLPESMKFGLYRPAKRAHAALKMIEREGIVLFAAQESGTYLERAAANHPYLRVVRATANTKIRRRKGTLERGNLFVYDSRVLKLDRDYTSEMSFDIPSGVVGRLSFKRTRRIYQLKLRFVHIESREELKCIAVHKPRNVKGYLRARRAMDSAFSIWAVRRKLKKQHGLIAGDFNGPKLDLPAMEDAGSSGPDHLFRTADLQSKGRKLHSLKRISDHGEAVSSLIGIPVEEKK